MQLSRWTRRPAIAFVTPAAYPSDGHGYGAAHGGGEPDQVPAVPIDTEAAAALTLSQAVGFAASTVCCCSKTGSHAERWMFFVQPAKQPSMNARPTGRRSAPIFTKPPPQVGAERLAGTKDLDTGRVEATPATGHVHNGMRTIIINF